MRRLAHNLFTLCSLMSLALGAVLAFLIGWAFTLGNYHFPPRSTAGRDHYCLIAERDALVLHRFSFSGGGFEARVPHWAGLPLLALLPTMSAVRMYRGYSSRRRRRAGLCRTCGYDLRGGGGGRCPECGRPVTVPSEPGVPVARTARLPRRASGRWAFASLLGGLVVLFGVQLLERTDQTTDTYLISVFGVDTPAFAAPRWLIGLGFNPQLLALGLLTVPAIAWVLNRVREMEVEE